MKIKLFLASSLLVLGIWLAAAYNHTVDISSYHSNSTSAPLQVEVMEVEPEVQAILVTK